MRLNVKSIARLLTPPLIVELYRKLQQRGSQTADNKSSPYLWQGIYKDHSDVPLIGSAFRSDWYVRHVSNDVKDTIEEAKLPRTIPARVTCEHGLLPLLAASVSSENGGSIRVLDFGGGLAPAYVHLTKGLAEPVSIEYHIVEIEEMCHIGRGLFEGDGRIHFYTSFPDVSGIDIIHSNGALHCVPDYRAVLVRLCAYKAKHILFVRVYAGDVPTYATAQINIPGTSMLCWFINVGELIEIMRSEGYRLVFKGAQHVHYDRSNFPPTHRVEHGCNLLFCRESENDLQ